MCVVPSEVLREILSRLPAEPLIRFRCVCKGWRDTIDDPIFVKLHLHRQFLNSSNSNGIRRIVLRGDLDNCFYSLSFESIESDCSKIVNAKFIQNCPLESCGGAHSLLSSCNGVMLISRSKGSRFLWNPLTMKYRSLPQFKGTMIRKSIGLYHSVSGLGYDSASDDYKVVKIAQVYDPRDRILKSETTVYGLKSNSWRRIKDFPYRISRMRGGIFVNGALHWISSTLPRKSMGNLIVGLDLGTEDYYLLPMPSEIPGSEGASAKHLDVLDGCLILSCYRGIERLDVWLMKDYGVSSSWIKLLTISAMDNFCAIETLRPIALSRCRRWILLQHDRKELVWFDLETKLGRKVRIKGYTQTFSSHLFVGSLLQLNAGVATGYGTTAEKPTQSR